MLKFPPIRAFGIMMRLLLTGLLLGPHPTGAQQMSEIQVKAAYLFSFAKFVKWPPEILPAPSDPIRLCILNDVSFQTQLDLIARNKSIDGHPILVILVQDIEQSRRCHELFISSTAKHNPLPILESLRGTTVLTVGETDGFVEGGGIINFIVQDDRVHFQVNQKAANQAGIRMSSQLLSLAKLVIR
jgi:hypothetical protein